MMPELDTILAYSLQVGCLAAAALALPLPTRITDPRVAYAYWRIALAIALLGPFVGSLWRLGSEGAAGPLNFVAATAAGRVDFTDGNAVVWLLSAGTAAMAVWRGVGVFRLGLYRRRAKKLSAEALFPAPRLEAELGVRPEYYETDEVPAPLTFGLLRHSILLPRRLRGLARDGMESILTHEMIHVRNHDWPQVLVEESVRCVLWFHPLVHLLIERVRSWREMSVDWETVRMTGDRGRYLSALMLIAEKQRRPAWIAAPPFGASRLKQRIEVLLEGKTMSKLRIVCVGLLAMAVFAIGGRWANQAFPVTAFAAERIQVDKSTQSKRAIRKVTPIYPKEARSDGIQGTVKLAAVVDTAGEIAKLEVIEGHPALIASAVDAVKQWRYAVTEVEGEAVEVETQIDITYSLSK